jgi:hypothetical protein
MGRIDLDRGGVVQAMKMMYYPFVHPPRPVLWQALLYWDELTSISPEAGYQFRHDLVVLRDLGLYRPTHADDLPPQARAYLMSDLRQVVEEMPGEDLVPVPGPLGPDNEVYWGKLPYEVEHDLVEIGAFVPQEGMLRASPVLLSRLMIVLAKHLAAAARGTIPFTDSPSANQVAFAPLGPDLRHRRCWQLQIGHLLPVPAPDASFAKVLEFRDAYADERQELAQVVRKLLMSMAEPGDEADPVAVQQQIQKAVQRLEQAGHARGIIWLKRSLWAFAGMGAAAAGAYALPHYGWLLTALSGLGISVATVTTRTGVSTEFAYLQHLRSTFPSAPWPTGTA